MLSCRSIGAQMPFSCRWVARRLSCQLNQLSQFRWTKIRIKISQFVGVSFSVKWKIRKQVCGWEERTHVNEKSREHYVSYVSYINNVKLLWVARQRVWAAAIELASWICLIDFQLVSNWFLIEKIFPITSVWLNWTVNRINEIARVWENPPFSELFSLNPRLIVVLITSLFYKLLIVAQANCTSI